MKRSIWPNRPLTPMEAGMVALVALLLVLCCLGTMVIGAFSPDPPAYQPFPTTSTTA